MLVLLLATLVGAATACHPVPAMNLVQRSGSGLTLDGQPFRFAGANIHWLGLVDSPTGGSPAYPTQFRITSALESAKEMGATVVRSHTLGISVACPQTGDPGTRPCPNKAGTSSPPAACPLCLYQGTTVDGQGIEHYDWNDDAFGAIDFAISEARRLGLRLVIPLNDNWNFYNGGRQAFAAHRNLAPGPTNATDVFYTDATLRADVKAYISHILDHENPLTHTLLRNEPAVLAWETGNEMRNTPPGPNQAPPAWGSQNEAWTADIAAHINGLAQQLVADGHSADRPGATGAQALSSVSLGNADIDMFSGHYYGRDKASMAPTGTGPANATHTAGKVFFVGEYDWTDSAATAALATETAPVNKYANADVTHIVQSGVPGSAQLWQQVTLASGVTYQLSFRAKAPTTHLLGASVERANGDVVYRLPALQALGTAWTTYSFSFTVPAGDAYKLQFNLANNTGQVHLDDVSLLDGTTQKVVDGGFEVAGTALPPSWTITLREKADEFFGAVEQNTTIDGSLFWELQSYLDGTGVAQGDKYAFVYTGDDVERETQVQGLRGHILRMRGLDPASVAHITPAAPVLRQRAGTPTTLEWQGVVGGHRYRLERLQGSTWVDVSGPIDGLSFAASAGTTYRVVALNYAGTAGLPSNEVTAT